MRFPWLDKMVEDGLLTKEASDRIETDCSQITKEAGSGKQITSALEQLVKKLQALNNQYAKAQKVVAPSFAERMSASMATTLGSVIPAGIAGAVGAHLVHKGQLAGSESKLQEVKESVIGSDRFTDDKTKAKAEARFNELASIAPHVAMNLPLAQKIVEHKLQKGFSDDDFQNLAKMQQKYTPDLGKQLDYIPKQAGLSEEKVGEILADVYQITKIAAPKDLATSIKRVLALSSIPILGGIGVGLANAYIAHRDEKELGKKLEDSYRKALAADNDQGEMLRGKKDRAREAFQALTHFAPQVAAEPSAANAFMAKMVAYDQGFNVSDIKELSEIQRNLHQIAPPLPHAITGFVGGTKSLGLSKAVEEGMSAAGR